MQVNAERDNNAKDNTDNPYTILIVDDDEALSRLNQKKLQREGFQTRCAFNGAEAINLVIDNPDSLMLLDYKLPDMTGKQIIENLNKRQINIPFIIVTGHGDERTAVEMMKLGARDYLSKDAAFLDLLPTVVNRVLDQINIEKKLVKFEEKIKKQIIDKSKEIEKINKEMNDFVYIISHDLKEPLFTIEGYSKRLSRIYEDKLDEKGKSYLKKIESNVEVMSNRIYEIMEVVKIGTVKYCFANNDSNAIVKNVISELESKINGNQVKLIIREDLPTIYCDEKRMKDVFSNLITNAIKFLGDNKQRQIKIGCDKNEDYYKFYVEDTGIGIREEHQEQVFKLFSRLKDMEAEGTGVGLAIVKKIVELHNGEIRVESPVKDGVGSRFCFTIPIFK